MYNVVFCGTPEFAVPSLVALHGDPDFNIELVLTQPDRPSGRGKKLKPSPIKAKALELGLTVETPERLRDTKWPEEFRTKNYDLGVVVAYGQILSQEFLDSFKHGCVNVHSSLLPRWRGAAPMQRAVMAGDIETGVSLQKVVKKLDAGDVIGERKMELPLEMGTKALYEILSRKGAELLTKDLKGFLEGNLQPVPQDPSKVTHAAKILKEEAEIDWTLSSMAVHNKIRGLDMGGPYAMTRFRDKTLKLHGSLPKQEPVSEAPGTVIRCEAEFFYVACGSGTLQIFEVQPESKAKMSAADFIRGYHVTKGDHLG